MDFDEYRKHGKEMVDYIADYLENIRDRRVFPNVKPGYMRNLLPDSAPVEGEDWARIVRDVERVIMPGITHWQSPHMHAYFPALNSGPSLLGDMLADAINCLGFTWASSPACTELEMIVMNWLGKMIGLPDSFLHIGGASEGGGVIQTTASESTLVCLLAGRTQAIRRFHEHTPGFQDSEINARLVAYCSDQAHSSVEKAALIGLVRMRYIESDDKLSLRGAALKFAIEDDIKLGLIPFWVCATLGTTGACSFDNLDEIGNVCTEHNLWLHVDAAYAGSAFICPEYRTWLKGIEKADSIAFNPSKWLMVHFDCTAMWVKNSGALHRTFNVEPLYLQHENSGLAIDYMGVRLAQKLEALVLADHRFEIPADRHLGMLVFRIKGENDLTERLLKRLNHRGNLHCVPASLKGKYVIRFTVTSSRTSNDDILKDWAEVRKVSTELLEELNVKIGDRVKVSLKDTREKNEAFGSSLLLANSPMSPKIVNGSFAAIFDTDEFLTKAYAGIRIASQNSPAMRRRVRGILMSGKQFSLDSRMDLVFHGIDTGVRTASGSPKLDDKNRAITEDGEESWEACEIRTPTPTTPASTSSSSDGIGSIRNYSNRPTIASNTPEVDQVHDVLFVPETLQPESKASATPSPLHEDIPSPMGHCFAFTSIDLPLCQSMPFASTQRRLEFRQSSMQSKSRSLKHSLGSIDLLHADDSADADEDTSDSNSVVNSSRNGAGNAFREKRQSDPQIRYAFCNRAFEEFTRSRRHSMMHRGERSRRPNMPNINEYAFEEDFVAYHTKEWPLNSLTAQNADDVVPVPRLKIRVCEDHGHSMDVASFDSTSSGEYSDSYCELDERINGGDDHGWSEETYYSYSGHSGFADPFAGDRRRRDTCNANKCAKCTHKCLVKQFTNSFDA